MARDDSHRTAIDREPRLAPERVGDDGITLAFPAEPRYVASIRRLVRGLADVVAGLEPQRIDDLLVAVSEACTNAIEAHMAVDAAVPIRLECRVSADRVEVRIVDSGRGFDIADRPGEPAGSHADRLRERGWGLQLMTALVDEIEFARVADGMAIRLALRNPMG